MKMRNLTSAAQMVHDRAKRMYTEMSELRSSKSEAMDWQNCSDDELKARMSTSDDSDTEKIYQVPSTPCYSDMSSGCMTKRPTDVPKRENRVLVLIIVSLTSFIQMFSRDIWIDPALMDIPAESQTSLVLLPIWNNIMGIFLIIPVCMGINKYGIKTSLLCSCTVTTIGIAVWCLVFFNYSTYVIHASTALLSCGSVFVKPIIATISVCCFRTGERNKPFGFMIVMSMAGTIAGYLVTMTISREKPSSSIVRTSSVADNLQHEKIIVEYVLYGCLCANFVCVLLVYLLFPRESSSECYRPSTKPFIVNVTHFGDVVSLLLIIGSYAITNAFSWPWYQMMDVTFSTLNFPQQVGVDCRLWMIIHTCSLTLFMCWFADGFIDHKRCIGLTCLLFASVFMMWFVLLMEREWWNLRYSIVAVMFAFPLTWSTQSFLFDLAADYAYPFPENVAVGLAEWLRIVCEICVYLLMAVFPEFDVNLLPYFALVAGLLSFILLLLLKKKSSDRHHTNYM